MKLNKKKVVALALAVCLIAILSMSTLAWFTDDDSITNDFMVGDTNTPADEVFGIEVWEDRDLDGDGNPDAEKVDGLEYDSILPGQALSKEPYLENTGIHPQFVRAIVTVTDASVLRDAMEGNWGNADLFLAGTPDTWVLEDILYIDGDQLVYVYYYTKPLEPKTVTDKIFKDVVIPTGLTKEQAAEIDSFQINILGQAIQSEHLGDPAAPGTMVTTAQRAFELYWDAEGTIAGYTAEQIKANAKINGDETADVYITLDENAASPEVSLTGEKITASKAVIKMADTFTSCITAIIDGCEITLEDGAYLVENDSNYLDNLIIISSDTTINGKAIGDMTLAEASQYFKGINMDMVWVDAVPGNWA